MSGLLRVPLVATILCLGADIAHGAQDGVETVIYREPVIEMPRVVRTFPDGLLELWLKALARPETELQCQSAASIALAHARGMPGTAVAIAPLTEVLDRPGQHPSVRLAAARALVALEARDAAAVLLRHAEDGNAELREVVEPALARWDFKPARAVWLERLKQPGRGHRSLVLAMESLAAVGDKSAAAALRERALANDQPAPERLAAAKALGILQTTGLEADARRLATESRVKGIPSKLLAATLLRRHTGAEAVQALQALAQDAEPAVARLALQRLVELDTGAILPFLPAVLASADADVRELGVRVLHDHHSAANLDRLIDRLSDAHPQVRAAARRALKAWSATAAWRSPAIERATRTLKATDWRGQEQAAILLAQLDQKPAASRLVELLRSPRPEVGTAAAYGLRLLAVAETLPKAVEHIEQWRDAPAADSGTTSTSLLTPASVDAQLSQLAQFIGQAKFKPGDAVLRTLVPRPPPTGQPRIGNETRAAAVWALAQMHGQSADAELIALIELRVTGDGAMGLDDERVRRMAAIALSRMNAKQSLEALRMHSSPGKPTRDIAALSCRWSIAQLTGEPMPAPGTVEFLQTDWFLTPVK